MIARRVVPLVLASGIVSFGVAAEPTPLAAPDVKALLAGNTLDAVTALKRFEGKPFRLHLKADGGLTIVTFEGKRDTGSWEVLGDGQYCSQYTETRKGMRKCFTVHRAGNGEFELRTLEGELSSRFSVRKGNPDNL
jgi:hypothetical protein